MGWNHPWTKIAYSLEELWINLRKGNFKRIFSAIGNRLRILAGARSGIEDYTNRSTSSARSPASRSMTGISIIV